jgi:polar amino acid transport system substrate-binding protein
MMMAGLKLGLGLSLAAMLATGGVGAQELRTAVDGTFAPHAFPDLASGGIQGFNVDLAKAIGEKLKRPLKIDSAQFSGLLPAMQAGTYDFIIAPVTATKERAESMLFTEGYLNTDFIFVEPRASAGAKSLADFKGKVVTVNKGSAYDSWARSLEGQVGWTVESFGTQTDAVQAVLAGRAAANITGNTVGAWAAKQNPALKTTYLHSTGLVWAATIRKGNEAMRTTIENAIECLKQDGTVAKLHEKWFGAAPAPGSAAVTVFPGTGVPELAGYDATPRTPSCG